jgi:RimJ/RimL family protein N-acetyltransferase
VTAVDLRLREFRDSDLDILASMVGDPEQMKFYPRPKTRADASAWIDRNRALYLERGYGSWLIELGPRSRFAGYCGIRPLDLEGVSEIEIGWHVHKRFWSRGIATRAATMARDAAARRFGLSRLIAVVHPDHVTSRRVAENLGMHQERTTVLEDDYPAVIYAAELPGPG